MWAVELRREASLGALQDRIGPPQLPDLSLELDDPGRVRRRGNRPRAHIDLGQLHPGAQRLLMHTELDGDPSDRP